MRYVLTNQKQKVTAYASSFHSTGEHTVFRFSDGLSIPHEKRINKQTNKRKSKSYYARVSKLCNKALDKLFNIDW